jgi:hypothetical protein
LAGDPSLDSESIRRHLCNNGFSEILDYVWGPKFFVNAFFAKPETDIETALEGWEEIYALYRNTGLQIEIKEEGQRLIDDTSSENFNRLNVLSEQKLEASKGIEESHTRRVSGAAGKH